MTTKYASLHKCKLQMFAGSTMMSFHSSNLIIFSSSPSPITFSVVGLNF